MWWAGSNAVDVYIGPAAAGVCGSKVPLTLRTADGLDAAIASAGAQLKALARPNLRMRVWLGGGLCQAFLLPGIEGLKSDAERWRVAVAAAAAHTAIDGDCAVWLDSVSSAAGTLAAAVSAPLPQRLADALAEQGRVQSIRPWWSEVLRAKVAMKGPTLSAFGVQDCSALTVLVAKGDSFASAGVTMPLSEADASRAAWTRALFAADVDEDAAFYARLDTAGRHSGLPDCAFGEALEATA